MNVSDYLPSFSAEQWAGLSAYASAASAVGTFVQALIAFFGLWFVGRQIRDARRASDVQNLFAFYKSITDAEQSFLNAKDADDKDRTFYELANLLETHAMALRGRIYTGVTKEAVELKLIDSCAFIQMSEFWYKRLEEGRSTQSSFIDLFIFINKKRRRIAKVKRLLQPSEAPETSGVDTAQQDALCDTGQEVPSISEAAPAKDPVAQ